jgi:hypothetical protein
LELRLKASSWEAAAKYIRHLCLYRHMPSCRQLRPRCQRRCQKSRVQGELCENDDSGKCGATQSWVPGWALCKGRHAGHMQASTLNIESCTCVYQAAKVPMIAHLNRIAAEDKADCCGHEAMRNTMRQNEAGRG